MNTPSLALYIHWPFCKSKCPYCDFNSHVRESVDQKRWKTTLLRELAWTAERMQGRRLTSIFFGGGTPSLMPPDTAGALIEAAKRHWQAADDIEITLEANPTSVESGRFADFAAAGVNRASLGVQSLIVEDLAFLGRKHSPGEALQAVELAAKHFPRYSFDLIYARPGQTVAAWRQELQEALAYAGDHLSLYQLTIEENTAFHHAYHQQKKFTLPEEDSAARLYEVTQEVMEAAGMPAYEISNHARPGQESRHNLSYWRGLEYAGIGPGAHGRIRPGVSDNRWEGWLATQTVKSPERWLEQVEREGQGMLEEIPLKPLERMEEWLMMRLRITEPLAYEALPFADAKTVLAPYAKEGLIDMRDDAFTVTPRGRLLLNALTGELAAYCEAPHPGSKHDA